MIIFHIFYLFINLYFIIRFIFVASRKFLDLIPGFNCFARLLPWFFGSAKKSLVNWLYSNWGAIFFLNVGSFFRSSSSYQASTTSRYVFPTLVLKWFWIYVEKWNLGITVLKKALTSWLQRWFSVMTVSRLKCTWGSTVLLIFVFLIGFFIPPVRRNVSILSEISIFELVEFIPFSLQNVCNSLKQNTSLNSIIYHYRTSVLVIQNNKFKNNNLRKQPLKNTVGSFWSMLKTRLFFMFLYCNP